MKGVYGLLVVLLYATFPGIYAIVAAATNDAFGPKYYQVIHRGIPPDIVRVKAPGGWEGEGV